MDAYPPPLPRFESKDAEHLRLIAVFHHVLAGFALLGLGFLAAHYAFMNLFLNNPEMWKNSKGGPPPAEVFGLLKWFYLFFGVLIVAGGVVNLVSGRCIQKRRARTFSLVVAGLNCAQMPFGTVLGVFTFVVLLRDSVRGLYARSEAGAAAPGGA